MQSEQNEGVVKYVSTVVMRVILVVTGIVQLMGEDVRNVENMVIFHIVAREKKVGLNLQNTTTSSSKSSIQPSIMIAGQTVEVDDKPILSNKTWCT